MPRNINTLAVPTAGPTVSATLELDSNEFLVGIQVGAAFDGTALTVTGNTDGSSTLVPVKDSFGNAVTITITDDTANYYYVPKEPFLGLTRVAFTSNAAQGAGAGETIRAITWSD